MADNNFSISPHELGVKCKHCGTNQGIKFDSRLHSTTSLITDISCINCKRNFAVPLTQEEIIGEPFAA
jgi:RNase P subunit RPR2